MIDFHSHIIPSIDDGSESVEETFKMLKEASEAGFDGIISTSHYIENYYETSQSERQVWIDALSQGLEKENIGINLYLGSEVYFSENMLHLIQEGKASTINNSNYILFEFPLNAMPMNIEDVLYSLLEHKYIPILAHPERYVFTQKNPNLIYDLANEGVLMQANYGSILGKYGKKAQIVMEKMLQNNLVNFLGTDAHKCKSVYTHLKPAINKINSIVGRKTFDEITHYNPMKVIKNQKIEIEKEPRQIKLALTDKMRLNIK